MAKSERVTGGEAPRRRVRFTLPPGEGAEDAESPRAPMAHPCPRQGIAGGAPFCCLLRGDRNGATCPAPPPYYSGAVEFVNEALGEGGYYAKLVRDEVRAAPDATKAALAPFRHHLFAPPLAHRWGAIFLAAPSFDAVTFGQAVSEEFGGPPGLGAAPGEGEDGARAGSGGEEDSSTDDPTDDPTAPGDGPPSLDGEEGPPTPPLRPLARRW